jgi:TonB family protein
MRLIVLAAFLTATARAQDSAAFRACDQPATGTFDAAFYGQLATIPKTVVTRIGPSYMDAVLEAIRLSTHPRPMALSEFEVSPREATLAAEATVVFTVARNGTVSDLGLASSSLSDPFDRGVLDAVRTADTSRLIPPLPDGAPSKVEFYLSVFTGPYPEPTDSAWRTREGLVRPLVTTSLPRWRGSTTVASPATKEVPRYPANAQVARVEDELLIRYVIGEDGKVILSTVFFESGTYQDFAKSIQDWLPRVRFWPAKIGGCAVKSLVRQPIKYSIVRQ